MHYPLGVTTAQDRKRSFVPLKIFHLAVTAIIAFAAVAPAQAHDWRNHFSTEIAYRVVNVASNDMLNVRSGPAASYSGVGALRPGTGGIYIQECQRHALWCRINVSTNVGMISGWVNTRYIGGYAN